MGYRATWKGVLAIGIVQAPVKVIKATEDNDVSFNLLHAACNGQVRQRKFCPECDIDLQTTDIVKGFNLDGELIPFTEDDLAQLPVSSAKTLEIYSVGSKPDPIRINNNYFIVPDKGGEYVFSVIVEALKNKGENSSLNSLISMRGRERPCSIWVRDDGIVLSTLRLSDEVRDVPAELKDVKKEEVELTSTLLTMLNKEMPAEDQFRQAVIDIATRKAAGDDNWKVPTPKVTVKQSDLLEALKASIAGAASPN